MISVVLYFLIVVALGLPIINRFNRSSFSLSLLISFAYLIGSSIIGLEYFLAIFVFKITNYSIFLWLIPAQALILWAVFFNTIKVFKPIKLLVGWNWIEKILLFFLSLIVCLSMFQSWLKPVIHWDAMTMWSYKAKLAYENPVGFLNPDSSSYWRSTGHANYPWQISFNQVFLSQLVGSFDDAWNNFVFVGFFVAILFILYNGVKIYSNRLMALLMAVLLASTPFVFYHSFNAYADLPLASMGLAGLVFLTLWTKNSESKDLCLALIFWALAFWIKNEGALFLLAGLVVLFIKAIKDKKFKKYLPVLFFGLPVLVWVLYLKFSNLGLKHTTEGSGWGFHPEVFSAFAQNLFLHGSWNIFWYIVVAWIFVYWKKISKNKYLQLILSWWLVMAALFVCIYLFSPSYLYAIDQTAFGRNLLTIVPSLFLIIGLSENNDE